MITRLRRAGIGSCPFLPTSRFKYCTVLYYAFLSVRSSLHNAGLYPTGELEAAKCDAVLDSVIDIKMNARPVFIEKDEAKKVRRTRSWSQGLR